MKALVYTAARQMEIQELPHPRPKPDEILLAVRASGVCGSDQGGFLGRDKRRIPPLVLGHEFSGQILEVGSKVEGVRPGMDVCVYPLVTCGQCRHCAGGQHHRCVHRRLFGLDLQGAFADYLLVPEQCLFPMPPGMTYVQGALAEPLATAIHAVSASANIRGGTGVVFGAGPIGIFHLLAAKHKGAARIAVVERNPHRLEAVRRLNADLVVDPRDVDPVETILDWTAGHGVDFAFDAAGNDLCRQQAIAALASGGTLTLVGLEEETSIVNIRRLQTGELTLRGSYAYTREDFAEALSLLEKGIIPAEELVSEVPLECGLQVFQELTAENPRKIKVVFTM